MCSESKFALGIGHVRPIVRQLRALKFGGQAQQPDFG
jgi:hypothetical protein